MNAFVLAAGFGTRLKPLTLSTPKPLVPVLNVPSICYSLFLLRAAGIDRAIINIHHHPDSIRDFFKHHDFGNLEILLSEEETILGTGGGLQKCRHLLGKEPFLLINSDIVSDIDIEALIRHHRAGRLGGTLVLHETPIAETAGDVGILEGRVLDFRNMRGTGLRSSFVYTGTAILEPEIFRYLRKEFSSVVDTGFTGLIDREGLGSFNHTGLWQDIGTLSNYFRTSLDASEAILEMEPRMRSLIGMGPKRQAESAEIGINVQLDNAVLGERCRIGSDCVIEHSVIMPDTIVPSGSSLRNAIATPEGIVQP